MKVISTIALFVALLLSGCGLKTGVKTSAQKSYLYFTGNTNDVAVSIDKGESFSVEGGIDNQYLVKPGKHLVEVSRKGQLIIKREVYISDGIAKEIEVK